MASGGISKPWARHFAAGRQAMSKAAGKRAAPKKASPKTKVTGPASYFPSIEKKYGKPIAEWMKLIRARMPARHMEIVDWLKTEHGMGHGHANALVGFTLAKGTNH
jgi:hypothetical protein